MDVGRLISPLGQTKAVVGIGLFFVLWCAEAWIPFWHEAKSSPPRLRHAGRNLTVTVVNVVLVGLLFSSATAFSVSWAESAGFGLLRWMRLPAGVSMVAALILMDAWMYAWHRMNHVVPFLWRFHRMHHSDPAMDVTTATRFHPGEMVFSSILRLAVIPLLGMSLWQVVIYELIFLPAIQWTHCGVRVAEWFDRASRVVFVSPRMHRVHHSRYQPETDSNYASILSVWDRLGGTFRLRDDPSTIELGLEGFDDPRTQTLLGLLKTPLGRQVRR